MNITIEFGWWLIPLVNTIAGFVWAWQPKFQDYTPGGYFPMPPTSFFAMIPAIIWALFNWLVYFIIF